jgi:hypothetical protein
MAVWTADEYAHWSGISNTTSTWATNVILSLTLSPTWYYFGQLATGTSAQTTSPITVNNSGANYYEDYQLSASSSTNWALSVSTPPGQSAFALQAVFNSTMPAIGMDYGLQDIVTSTPTTCTNAVYSVSGSSTGVRVDPFNNSGRSLWFKLFTPLAVGTTTQQGINFTVTATQSSP